ncbi:MAG: chemotaxis protein CheW [Anaerolineae bacterium]|jgi:purine-binding chemotaxis protein CheW|nr:chemotaxis protein CheW [Anaerolineae bacterium]
MSQVDWRVIRENITWNEADSEQALLKQRADQYAAPQKRISTDENTHSLTVLAFDLGTERYAVEVSFVRAVRSLSKITPVPGVPDFYRGVMNLRGQIITLMDLRRFFEMTAEHQAREVIIVQGNRLELGLLADHVQGIQTLSLDDLHSAEHMKYLKGVTASRLVVLDLAALFEDERLIIGGLE